MVTTVLVPLALFAANAYPMTLHNLEWGADPEGFYHGTAFHFLAPKGWKPFAITGWNLVDTKNLNMLAGAFSPDERFGYAFCPGFWQTFNGMTSGNAGIGGQVQGFQGGTPPPARLSDWAMEFLKIKQAENLHVVSREDRPLGTAGGYQYGQASQVKFVYTLHGQPMEGMLVGRMVGTVNGNPNAPMHSYSGYWGVQSLAFVTYPKGEQTKGMKFFSLAVPTYTPTVGFIRAVEVHDGVLKKMYAGIVREQIERSQIQAKVAAERESALMSAWRSRRSESDKFQRDFCDYIGDTRRSRNSDGTELQTNSNDGQPWSDGKGNVAFGDNPGPGWTALKKWND